MAATSTVFASTGNNYTTPGPTSDAILALLGESHQVAGPVQRDVGVAE